MAGAEAVRIGAAPRLWTRPDVAAPAAMLSAVLVACFVGPIALSLPEPVGGAVLEAGLPLLSSGHVLGTDLNGNDVLSRLLHGGRSSLLIAISANAIGLLFGALLGAVSAFDVNLEDYH